MNAPSDNAVESPRRVVRDVLLWWGIGLVVLAVTGLLAGIGGFVGRNQGAISAGFFLLAPALILRRRGVDPAALGISLDRPLSAAGWAILAGLVAFPPYVGGYEAWSRILSGAPFRLPSAPLSYFDPDLRGRPVLDDEAVGVRVWIEQDDLHVLNASGSPVRIAIDGCACPRDRLALRSGGLFASRPAGGCSASAAVDDVLPAGAGIRCSVDAAPGVAIRGIPDGVPILAGVSGVSLPSGPATFDRSLLWIPELLLIHLVVVALPEEVFYRGFVQGRLRAICRRRWRFLGADVGWEIPLASGLFAFSHLVTIPAPFRLAVFFPGLAFGWLAARTGSVLAPAMFHALCNVLLEVLVRWH